MQLANNDRCQAPHLLDDKVSVSYVAHRVH